MSISSANPLNGSPQKSAEVGMHIAIKVWELRGCLTGYYARVTAYRMLVEKFIRRTNKACQVISLGAGFDTLFWHLCSKSLCPTLYLEIDFNSVVARKCHTIRCAFIHSYSCSPVINVYLQCKVSTEGYAWRSHILGRWYPVLSLSSSCRWPPGHEGARWKDLVERNWFKVDVCVVFDGPHVIFPYPPSFPSLPPLPPLVPSLSSSSLCSLPTMILAECVLVYMEPDKSKDIVHWFGKHFPTALFLNYEPVSALFSY